MEKLYFKVSNDSHTFYVEMPIEELTKKIESGCVFKASTVSGITMHINGACIDYFMTENEYNEDCYQKLRRL